MLRIPGYSAFVTILAASAGVLAFAGCSSESEPNGGVGGAGGAGMVGSAGALQASGGVSGMQGVAGSTAPVGGAPPQAGSPGSAGSPPAGGAGSTSTGGASTGGRAGASSGGSAGTISGGSSFGGAPSAGAGGKASGGSAGSVGTAGASGGSGGGASNDLLAKFSFFVASMKAMQTLAKSEDGFGGDLRFGKADGLSGADEICRQVAEMGLPGAGNKQWRAFLSTVGPPAVNARDRIGQGPWYDVKGRLVSQNLTDLLGQARPKADAAIANDLPNERGEPNHFVGPDGYTPGTEWDNHDTLTGSKNDGTVYSMDKSATCQDWTSLTSGRPRLGHSWPRSQSSTMGAGWASDHNANGCAAGYYLDFEMPAGSGNCVGCGGGYGGIYCFAINQP